MQAGDFSAATRIAVRRSAESSEDLDARERIVRSAIIDVMFSLRRQGHLDSTSTSVVRRDLARDQGQGGTQ